MKKVITALVLLTSILSTNAQSELTGEDDFGSWFMYFGTNKIADRWSIHTEAQFRYYEMASNFNQTLLRTGLNYHINPDAIATLGYGFIDTDPTFTEFDEISSNNLVRNNSISEHRIFEQFILKNKVWEFKFEHRYRLEQRFVQNNYTGETNTLNRARYRIQMTLPLTDIFFLNFYDEIFINLQDSAFGQNRAYAALGVNVTEDLSMQFGYLKNHFTGANFDRLQIGVFYNTDLRGIFKKKN
ncbi:DUF2490 domain-containing protein [Maribacter litoralis]|uniref:DUF2490 domain-containing protein n=1 Tax=Maribacter litoralis TaxID=2059726 RepID=A0A653Y5C7_9FLAO|nr:DUF2490 domain-containing protein [Maribacter litoralis]VXC37515.1 conserved exported hypothetical protein [Maribacter litoralis]